MFGGPFICICRSVCWDNGIVMRVFGMFGGILFLRGLFSVYVIFGGFLNHSSLESLLCFDCSKCSECLVGFLFVFIGVFVWIMLSLGESLESLVGSYY